jgi:hypothetical protein
MDMHDHSHLDDCIESTLRAGSMVTPRHKLRARETLLRKAARQTVLPTAASEVALQRPAPRPSRLQTLWRSFLVFITDEGRYARASQNRRALHPYGLTYETHLLIYPIRYNFTNSFL